MSRFRFVPPIISVDEPATFTYLPDGTRVPLAASPLGASEFLSALTTLRHIRRAVPLIESEADLNTSTSSVSAGAQLRARAEAELSSTYLANGKKSDWRVLSGGAAAELSALRGVALNASSPYILVVPPAWHAAVERGEWSAASALAAILPGVPLQSLGYSALWLSPPLGLRRASLQVRVVITNDDDGTIIAQKECVCNATSSAVTQEQEKTLKTKKGSLRIVGHLANAAHIFSLSVLANWAALGLISQALRMQTDFLHHHRLPNGNVSLPEPLSLPSPSRKRAHVNDDDQGDEEEETGGGGGGGKTIIPLAADSHGAVGVGEVITKAVVLPTSLTKINVFPEGIELIFSSTFHRQSMSFLLYARAYSAILNDDDQVLRASGSETTVSAVSKELVTTTASSIAKLVGDAVCLGPFEPHFLTDLTTFAATAFEGLKGVQ